jgi:hypothetical protein
VARAEASALPEDGIGGAVLLGEQMSDAPHGERRQGQPRRAVDAATERFEAGQERSLQGEQRRRIAQLERALGRKTYELEIAGEALRGWE